MERRRKSSAFGGIQTLDHTSTRRVFFRCATTAALRSKTHESSLIFLEISPPPGEIFDQLLTPFRFGGHEKKCRKKLPRKKQAFFSFDRPKHFYGISPQLAFSRCFLTHNLTRKKTPLLTLFHSLCLPYSPSHTYFSSFTGSHSPPRPLSHIPISDF